MATPSDALRFYSDNDLRNEEKRRADCWAAGVCCFCGQPYTDPACERPDRHARAGRDWHRGWRLEYGSSFLTAVCGDDDITISRHGSLSISLSRPQTWGDGTPFRGSVYRTVLEVGPMGDRERFETAVDHVIALLERGIPADGECSECGAMLDLDEGESSDLCHGCQEG